MAKNDLNVLKLQVKQSEQEMEEDVIMTVNDFNDRQDMIKSTV